MIRVLILGGWIYRWSDRLYSKVNVTSQIDLAKIRRKSEWHKLFTVFVEYIIYRGAKKSVIHLMTYENRVKDLLV